MGLIQNEFKSVCKPWLRNSIKFKKIFSALYGLTFIFKSWSYAIWVNTYFKKVGSKDMR